MRRTPWTPIFDVETKRGGIAPGVTPLTAPPAGSDPVAAILYDTRNHDGSYPSLLLNEGTIQNSGMWDLTLERLGGGPGSYTYLAVKRYNWFTQGTTGNGVYATGWDDIGGHPNDAPLFYFWYYPANIDVDGHYLETEWYYTDIDANDPQIALAVFDYADPGLPDGFTNLGYDNFNVFDEFDAQAFGPGAAGQRSAYGDCLVAHYVDQASRTHRFYIDDGTTLYSFEHVFASDDTVFEDATYEWIEMNDYTGGAASAMSDPVARMFWSVGWHDETLFGAFPGAGSAWGNVVGIGLARPDHADVDVDAAYVRYWWDYFNA